MADFIARKSFLLSSAAADVALNTTSIAKKVEKRGVRKSIVWPSTGHAARGRREKTKVVKLRELTSLAAAFVGAEGTLPHALRHHRGEV